MINERDISEKFTAIWKQNFPMLTSNFIRVFNIAEVRKINNNPIPHIENIRHDIVSELAFNLCELLEKENSSLDQIINNKRSFDNLIIETARTIWTSGNYSKSDLKIQNSEINQIRKLSFNILEFININKDKKLTFRPKLKGYSFIPNLTADISIDDTLYEIKTVNRNFKSSDLKQLLIYLALKQVEKGKNWKYAGLYNPKKGIYCKFNVKSLIHDLSGGKTPNETFENFLNGLIRDIEIDSNF